MGFTEVLTIVFVVMKLVGVVDWAWIVVFAPELIMLGFYLVGMLVWVILSISLTRPTFGEKLQNRLWEEWDELDEWMDGHD